MEPHSSPLFSIYRSSRRCRRHHRPGLDVPPPATGHHAGFVKARNEVVAEIARLEAAVANGETPDFTALKAAVQSVDDIVPDPAPEPAPAPVDVI